MRGICEIIGFWFEYRYNLIEPIFTEVRDTTWLLTMVAYFDLC